MVAVYRFLSSAPTFTPHKGNGRVYHVDRVLMVRHPRGSYTVPPFIAGSGSGHTGN